MKIKFEFSYDKMSVALGKKKRALVLTNVIPRKITICRKFSLVSKVTILLVNIPSLKEKKTVALRKKK